MTFKTNTMDYQDGKTTLEGFYAYSATLKAKQPAVIVVHDWSGKNDFVCQKAQALAALGYVGFALDVYGKGKLGHSREEKTALLQPFIQDRKMLLHRLLAGVQAVKSLDMVDPDRISAIGFCFGGLCVLDLARSGAPLKSVISFHGLLNPPHLATEHSIKAKILALHGYADPMVAPEQVLAFADEMTEAKANFEIDMYGHTMHAFTNPSADDPDFGTVYSAEMDKRAWIRMQAFLQATL